MNENVATVIQRVNALVDEYRARCLWFLREDYNPQTPAEACRVLESIGERGPTVDWSQQTPQWGALALFFDGLMLRAARHASGVSWRDLSRGGSWGPPGRYSHNWHGQGAKSVLHRSGRGQHQHRPARPTNHAPRENSNLRFEAASARAAKPAQEWPVSVV